MSTYRLGVLSLSILLAFSAVSSQARAQEAQGALCPGYGQSVVTVTILPLPSAKVAAGATLPVTIRLTNLESYSFSESALLVRLVATSASDRNLAETTGAIFGRSVPLSDIFLGGKESKEFTLSLDIPPSLPTGEYALEAIFVPSDFDFDNIEADLASGGKANAGYLTISVDGQTRKDFAYILSNSASVAEAEDGSISAQLEIANTGSRVADVPLLWKIYSWSAIDEESIILSEVQTVRIPASGKAKVSYPISADEHSLYMAVAEAVSGDLHTFAVVRAADLRGEAAVRLLGLASESGSGMKAFACVYNVFSDDEESRTLSLAVTDGSGTVLGDNSFSIASGVSDSEFSMPFEIRGSGDVVLAASVFSSRGVEGRLEKIFRCTDLGTCAAAAATEEPADLSLIFSITLLSSGVGGILAVVCLKRRKRRKFIVYTS